MGRQVMIGMNENRVIAGKLREAAVLLEAQGASPFRVTAYRNAAATIDESTKAIRAILEAEGLNGLDALPHIGRGIAAAIAEMLTTGRWSQLDRLRGASGPQALFQSLPGIGPLLAQRIHETLHVDTLEALEIAAHDGRLERVPRMGARRAAACRAVLDAMLRRMHGTNAPSAVAIAHRPAVATVLDVDREYREKAHSRSLPAIAPRRFNPDRETWLPILHTRRDVWHFTALYSNTANAHKLHRTHDWVVVYFYDDAHVEGQNTVVTETHGPLTGRRVVRGREAECRDYYAHAHVATALTS